MISEIITGVVCAFLGHMAGRRNRKPKNVFEIKGVKEQDIEKLKKHLDKFFKAKKK